MAVSNQGSETKDITIISFSFECTWFLSIVGHRNNGCVFHKSYVINFEEKSFKRPQSSQLVKLGRINFPGIGKHIRVAIIIMKPILIKEAAG